MPKIQILLSAPVLPDGVPNSTDADLVSLHD